MLFSEEARSSSICLKCLEFAWWPARMWLSLQAHDIQESTLKKIRNIKVLVYTVNGYFGRDQDIPFYTPMTDLLKKMLVPLPSSAEPTYPAGVSLPDQLILGADQ